MRHLRDFGNARVPKIRVDGCIYICVVCRHERKLAGFDWDEGNRAKCQRHGVSTAEVEGLFNRPLLIIPDTAHSQGEERLRAIGKTARGRSVFLVFTIRELAGKRFIRPVSARYMHRREVKHYEEENPDV